MIRLATTALALIATVLFTVPVFVQSPQAQRETPGQEVPRVISAEGQLLDASGKPLIGRTWVTFRVYGQQDAVEAMWTEAGWVSLAPDGTFAVVLGHNAPGGLPTALFAAGEARWLGVTAEGGTEGPRKRLVSVPYALKALDAATLGGRPASDYALASELAAAGAGGPGVAAAAGTSDKSVKGIGTANFLTKWLGVDMVGDSGIFETNGNIGIGTTSPASKLHLVGNQTIAGTLSLTTSLGSGYASSFRNVSLAAGSGGAYGEGTKWGLVGIGTGTSATSIGVWGAVNADPGGLGVFGWHNIASGTGAGVRGATTSPNGTGVLGDSIATSGTPIGVRGAVLTAGGTAGQFDNDGGGTILQGRSSGVEKFRVDGGGNLFANALFNLSGTPIGTGTVTNVATGTGLTGGPITAAGTLALDVSFTDARYATVAHGHVVGDVAGAATLGANTFIGQQQVTGTGAFSPGILAINNSTDGYGVRAVAAGTGLLGDGMVGIRGDSGFQTGIAVRAHAGTSSGANRGVYATTNSGTGTAVLGEALNASGQGVGLHGRVFGTSTIAGVFENTAGGVILKGIGSGTEKFRVDGAGNVYANGLFNLAGSPMGTGTVTSVGTGTGLTGGTITSTGTLALDVSFTDARYAAAAHGHTVGQVSGAATLGANSFVGNQHVTGTLTATNTMFGLNARFTSGVIGELTQADGQAVRGDGFLVSNGTGVLGRGSKYGVHGVVTTSTGTAIIGETQQATGAAIGVHGITVGSEGTAVKGVASATSGINFGVHGSVISPTGAAGLFEHVAGTGDLLRGRSNNSNVFRVDGAGAVYASSYRDLAGNPVGGGTVTSVGTGTGLTGGTITGSGTLALDVSFTDARYAAAAHGHTVSQVSGAATLAANTFSGTQTISSGNLDLGTSSSITRNGSRYIHHTAGGTFVGGASGNLSSTAIQNTGIGSSVLSSVTTGNNNTAVGAGAMQQTTTGGLNLALGTSALASNSSGGNNTALGMNALLSHPGGSGNTAAGRNALVSLTSGDNNVAVGLFAGQALTTGSNNLYLANPGVASESGTIRIGQSHTSAFMAGVRGVTTINPDAIPVMVDSNGQLGTISSSRRFKEDIRDMNDISARLFQLRPVTFRYTKPYGNGTRPLQFGLVAEEVADVFPELAVRNAKGEIETVHYETLNVLLLNELQKQQRRIDDLERRLNDLLSLVGSGGREKK
jgi:hypothetical protein